MRLLIAAGGTGGHIYPALAVASSLRARPDAAELTWLGGHRGLEASLVPAAGIPLRRLLLRSLRTVDVSAHAILDPLRLGASVPQAAAILAASGRTPSSRRAATSRCRSCSPRPRSASRSCCGRATRSRVARSVPTARLADVLAVSFAATCAALATAAPGARAT